MSSYFPHIFIDPVNVCVRRQETGHLLKVPDFVPELIERDFRDGFTDGSQGHESWDRLRRICYSLYELLT